MSLRQLAQPDVVEASMNLDQKSRELIEQGRLIEAGFCLRILTLDAEAAPEHTEALRNAFFAGAHHLFSCMVTALDPTTTEPTAADLLRMDQIEAELADFIKDFATRQLATKGSA
jgi:hypothetical protein